MRTQRRHIGGRLKVECVLLGGGSLLRRNCFVWNIQRSIGSPCSPARTHKPKTDQLPERRLKIDPCRLAGRLGCPGEQLVLAHRLPVLAESREHRRSDSRLLFLRLPRRKRPHLLAVSYAQLLRQELVEQQLLAVVCVAVDVECPDEPNDDRRGGRDVERYDVDVELVARE